MNGTLQLGFSSNTYACLTSLEAGSHGDEIIISVDTNQGTFQIREGRDIIISGLESEISGEFELQSQLTGKTVDQVALTGDCDLPQLSAVINAQGLLISALKSHWEGCEKNVTERLPIT